MQRWGRLGDTELADAHRGGFDARSLLRLSQTFGYPKLVAQSASSRHASDWQHRPSLCDRDGARPALGPHRGASIASLVVRFEASRVRACRPSSFMDLKNITRHAATPSFKSIGVCKHRDLEDESYPVLLASFALVLSSAACSSHICRRCSNLNSN